MTAQTQKMLIGAAVFTAIFYAARRGMLSMETQQYAIDISTKPIIDGINF
jgi:hypothetical protein